MTEAGGDPACWAGRVCPECGRLDERAPADRDGRCPHCGAELTAEHTEELERIGLEYRDLDHDLPEG
jgi:tRNA(Ile2) C34 agmatinyltransferase TiaS